MAISKDAQKVLAGLDQATKDYVLKQGYGGNLTSGEARTFVAQYNATKKKVVADVPDFLKNDPTFNNLSPDMQEIAVYNYKVQVENNAQKVKALADALETATAQADPYWKNIIRIAQTEVQNGFAEITGDYNAQNENLKRQVQAIHEDLATNKDNLTLDEQAQLGSLAADLNDRQQTFERNMNYLGGEKAAQLSNLELDYNKNIDDINRNTTFTQEQKASALDKISRDFTTARGTIIGNAADAGLTFSTKRKIAETRLAKENEGLVESTTRGYNKQLADMESAKSYTEAQYGANTASTERQFGQRTAEEEAAYQTSQRLIQEQREKLQRDYAMQIAKYETDASRGDVNAKAAMDDLQRKLSQSIQNLGLSAEKALGTENLPGGLPGYSALGNVPGSIYEDKTKDIATRQAAIYNEKVATSLNF